MPRAGDTEGGSEKPPLEDVGYGQGARSTPDLCPERREMEKTGLPGCPALAQVAQKEHSEVCVQVCFCFKALCPRGRGSQSQDQVLDTAFPLPHLAPEGPGSRFLAQGHTRQILGRTRRVAAEARAGSLLSGTRRRPAVLATDGYRLCNGGLTPEP